MGFFEENKNEAISEMLSNQLERSALNKKCLLMTFIGAGIGDTCIFPAERKNHLAPNVAKIEPLDDSISLDYAVFALMGPCGQRGVNAIKKSTAQPSLSMETIRKLLIPIPPLKEQKCISLKLSEALPLVEKYSKVQEEQNQLNVEIQYFLKKSILQEAIQGKLVPQIAEEGTAKELLDQIQAEKHKLVKEGRLKKSALTDSVIYKGDDNKYYEQIGKQCKEITEEIPFDLPDSWSWTRGKTVFMPMESTKPITDFTYIDVDAVNNKLNIIDNPKKINIDKAPSRATRKLHSNDILFSMVRPYLRNIALVNDTYKSAIASTGFYVITPGIGYFPKFLFYLMLSNYVIDGLNTFMKGDNSPSINNGHIENYLYPLPPIKEQQRIVAQIERLFEQLK